MRRKTISLAIIVTIASVGILVALVFVLLGQKATTAYQTNQIAQRSDELSAIPNIDEYLTIQAQLDEIDGLHATKLNASRLLEALPRLNPADPNTVRFSNVDLSAENGTVTFQGGVRNVSALTTFKDALVNAQLTYQLDGDNPVTEPLFSAVDVTEYGYSADSEDEAIAVGFTITTTYNPKLFETNVMGVRVSVPNMETTHSVVASPDVTFDENAGNLEESDE